MISISHRFTETYPNARAGILIMHGVSNPRNHAELNRQKQQLEQTIRARFGGKERADIRALEPIQAYSAYYRRFKKTYHVQLQLESIAFKDKDIPAVAALVEAMFMAELKNLLLTAGHDLTAIQQPVTLDVSTGDERYTTLGGHEQTLKTGDMMFTDAAGVISSVIYGPDRRTRIATDTTSVLFTTYAPAGIDSAAVFNHLEDIRDYVHLVAPDATVEMLDVIGANAKP